MGVVPGGDGPRGRLTALATALDDAATLLDQAIAVLRAWPPIADLTRCGIDDPADLPVSLADRALLTVYEMVIGAPLEHTVACDTCGELTTLSLARNDIPEHHPLIEPTSRVREPTWRDLLASGDDAVALLARCGGDEGATMEDLARAEGSLSGPLHAACPGCGARLELNVDLMALVMRALGAISADLDRDVHALASRYGWSLAAIETLPDDRRRRLALMARYTP